MVKKSYVLIILVLILISMNSAEALETSSLEIRVDKSQAYLNEDITVEIIGKNIRDLAGLDIILDYNSEVLEYISENINIPTNDYINIEDQSENFKDEAGQVRIMLGLKRDAQLITADEVVLATIKFKPLREGISNIEINNLTQVVKGDNSGGYIYDTIDFINNGVTIIKKASIGGSLILDDEKIIDEVKLELWKDNSPIKNVTIKSDEGYKLTGLDEGSYTIKVVLNGYKATEMNVDVKDGENKNIDITLERIYEDVNRDGKIDLGDLVAVGSQYKLKESDIGFNIDCDINRDRTIDLLDLIHITRKINE